MKAILLLSLFSSLVFVSHSQVYQYSATDNNKLAIRDKFGEETYTATFHVQLNGKNYKTSIEVEADDWGEVLFPQDFETKEQFDFGAALANVKVTVGGETAYEIEKYLSPHPIKKAIEVPFSEIKDEVDCKGDKKLTTVLFWHDNSGYNYIIRAKEKKETGLYAYHYKVDGMGKFKRISMTQSIHTCKDEKIKRQAFVKDFQLHDADQDGRMEAYVLWVDDCQEEIKPMFCRMTVFTHDQKFVIDGYSIVDEQYTDPDRPSGYYQFPVELNAYPKIKNQAGKVYQQLVQKISQSL